MSRDVSAMEHGKIRIFQLSAAVSAALAEGDLAPLEKALGVIIAKPDDVQVIPADSLAEMGLRTFLETAYGVATGDVPDETGHPLAVIRSGAFGGAAVTLADSPDAKLIGTLREDSPVAPNLQPLQSDGAQGTISDKATKPPKSDARIGGMIATYVLIFLFALVGLMIWVAS